LAVYVTAQVLPGVTLSNFSTAIVVTIILGLVNAFIKPVFILLTLPVSILTLGLFTFVINALMVIIVDMLISGFEVRDFWWALAFSLVLSLVTSILFSLTRG
jgi:putative membrane protein